MTMIPDLFQSSFAIHFLLQAPERLLHRLAFLKSDFGQNGLTSFL